MKPFLRHGRARILAATLSLSIAIMPIVLIHADGGGADGGGGAESSGWSGWGEAAAAIGAAGAAAASAATDAAKGDPSGWGYGSAAEAGMDMGCSNADAGTGNGDGKMEESIGPEPGCTGASCTARTNYCSLTAEPAIIVEGSNASLAWTTRFPGRDGSVIVEPGLGSVAPNGGAIVRPAATTEYQLSMFNYYNGQLVARCSVTVNVRGLSTCTPEYFCANGSNRFYRDAECRTTFIRSCPVTLVGGGCSATSCLAEGQPPVPPPSPVPPPPTPRSCIAGYFCVGNDLYYRSARGFDSGGQVGGQCSDSLVQRCSYQCAGGACVAAPPSEASIAASPHLVRQSGTTVVSWNAANVRACSVAGTNGDSWTGTSGSRTSSPIAYATTYTLSCVGLDDSTITDTAVVTVLPVWQEL